MRCRDKPILIRNAVKASHTDVHTEAKAGEVGRVAECHSRVNLLRTVRTRCVKQRVRAVAP